MSCASARSRSNLFFSRHSYSFLRRVGSCSISSIAFLQARMMSPGVGGLSPAVESRIYTASASWYTCSGYAPLPSAFCHSQVSRSRSFFFEGREKRGYASLMSRMIASAVCLLRMVRPPIRRLRRSPPQAIAAEMGVLSSANCRKLCSNPCIGFSSRCASP